MIVVVVVVMFVGNYKLRCSPKGTFAKLALARPLDACEPTYDRLICI